MNITLTEEADGDDPRRRRLRAHFARIEKDQRTAAAISAIETRIQQLEQCDEQAATVELEWALKLIKGTK